MAVDPTQFEDLSGQLHEIIDPAVTSQTEQVLIAEFEKLLINEISELLIDGRSPRIYVFGRSGAGKSSLINALTNGGPANVAAVEPTTTESAVYERTVSGQNNWELIDSRGLFESTAPEEAEAINTEDQLEHDLTHYDPDLLLHVMTPGQVRAGGDDLKAIQELEASVSGGLPPRVVCLNKVDTFRSLGEDWPPEQHSTHARSIERTLELIADSLSVTRSHPVIEGSPFRGLWFDSREIIGAIPLYVKQEPYWNLTSLTRILNEQVPTKALLQCAEAPHQNRLMRRLASKQTETIATAVSEVPRTIDPSPTTAVISSYQRYLVALIGTLAGDEFGVDAIEDYFDSRPRLEGVLTSASATLDRVVDIPLSLLSNSLPNLSAQTFGLGRSAEAYFFDGEMISPRECRPEGSGGRIRNHISRL